MFKWLTKISTTILRKPKHLGNREHGRSSDNAERNTFFSMFSGGTSLETLAKDFREALNNEDIKAILFDIDSPGGVAVGPMEMAEMI